MARAPKPARSRNDPPEKQPGEVWVDEGARLIMVSPERVRQLIKGGDVPRGRTRGVVMLVGLVQGYINFLKRDKRDASRSAAEDRIRDARAREIELRNAQRDHVLIELEEAIGVADEIVGIFRSELIGLPARLTRDRQMRARLENEFTDTLNRVADRLAERASALKSTGVVASDEEEDTGAGMGGAQSRLPADKRTSRTA